MDELPKTIDKYNNNKKNVNIRYIKAHSIDKSHFLSISLIKPTYASELFNY